MGNAKVTLNGTTLIDLTSDTVTTSALLSGYIAHASDGEIITGEYVPVSVSLTAGSTNPSESSQHIIPPSGYDGFSYFDVGAIDSAYVGSAITRRSSTDLSASGSIVSVPSGYYSTNVNKAINAGSATTPTKTISITPSISINSSTGVITATAAGSSSITPTVSSGYVNSGTAGTVSVSGSNTSALSTQGATTITPTESVQTAVESGRYTLGNVIVAAISSDYIGSGVAQKSAADLTASGSVITAPAGYYTAAASKSVQSGSATTPSVTITATPSITIDDNGVINVTVADSSNISPTVVAGYVSQGTAGTITISASGNKGMGTYGTRTITPSTSTYALQPKNYLTGLITIQGDSDLVSSNIKNNVKIFDVTGTFTDSSTVSVGQSAASSSEIMQGYSAWVNGEEVKGSIATTSIVEGITTVSGSTATRGIAEWSSGNITSGQMDAATFANSSSAQIQYVDISDTTDAPVLVSGGYLYINKGYTDDLKISLAKLVPDGASADLASDKILSGYAAYNNDGTLIAGNIPSKSGSNVTVAGPTISIPSGYYSSDVSKTVTLGAVKSEISAPFMPQFTIDNTGTVIATQSTSTQFSPLAMQGYIDNGYTFIEIAGSSSYQLDTIAATTITPTESVQTAVASGKYTLGAVQVAAISSNYIGSGVATKAATTYTPSSATQTISSGQYLTGTQTIAGDTNLVGENIIQGITIFGVAGTATVGVAMTTAEILAAVQSGWNGTS